MPKFCAGLAVHVEVRRIDPQLIARRARQPLDVKRRARFRIFANAEDVIRAENKNIAARRDE